MRPGRSTAGYALLWVALLAVALFAIGAFVFLGSEPGSAPPNVDEVSRGNAASGEGGAAGVEPLDPADPMAEGPRTVGGIAVSRPHMGLDVEKKYDGFGTIAGEVRTESIEMPEVWTLHIEPSRFGPGRKTAAQRTVGSEPRARSFEEHDLPLGSYRVFATAPGLRSRATEVPLYTVEGGAATPRINLDLVLRPMASVDGTVRQASGDVADGMPMYLVPNEAGQATRSTQPVEARAIEAATDAAGVFRFEDVEPGPWLLFAGDARNSFVTPLPITVQADPIRLDEVVLPELATVDISVVDEAGRPFPDVELTGYLRGDGKGSLRTKTDAVGHAVVRYLPTGPWRIEAEYAPERMSGRADTVLEASDEPQDVEILVRELRSR